jgi:hypothetical protein
MGSLEVPERRRHAPAFDALVILLAAVFGAVLWLEAPRLTGERDAFDSPLYPVYLFLAGAVFAACLKTHGWLAALAILLGQLMGFGTLVARGLGGPLWPLGIAFVVAYSPIALAGAFVPVLYRHVAAKRNP